MPQSICLWNFENESLFPCFLILVFQKTNVMLNKSQIFIETNKQNTNQNVCIWAL